MYKENYFDNKRLCFSHEYIGDFLLKHDIYNKSYEKKIDKPKKSTKC
jgi:hypothetical protein